MVAAKIIEDGIRVGWFSIELSHFCALFVLFSLPCVGLKTMKNMWETNPFELTQALTDDFLQTLQSQRQFSKFTLKTLFCGKMRKQYLGFSSMIHLF